MMTMQMHRAAMEVPVDLSSQQANTTEQLDVDTLNALLDSISSEGQADWGHQSSAVATTDGSAGHHLPQQWPVPHYNAAPSWQLHGFHPTQY